MKQLIQNLIFLTIAALIISACSEENNSVSAPEIKGAKFISFGFYVEDNAGIIEEDYVVEGEIRGNEIIIKMPSKIDKSSLIARFTTSNDNPKVTVNGKDQVSKQTVNDYTIPVDFLLKNDELNNRKYTVRVKRPIEWIKQKNRHSEFKTSASMIKVNPIDNVPYVMVIKDATADDDKKAALIKFEENAWFQVGDDISDGRVADIDFTFDATGNPYVVYSDYKNTISRTATVKYFDGSSWITVGQNYNDVRVTYNSICYDSQGKLNVFSMNDVAGGVVGRRLLNISTYNGSLWTSNQTIPGRTFNSYNMRSVLKNGILYLTVYDYANNSGTISVYKYSEGTWSTLAQGLRHENATAINNYDLSMAVDSKGNVYIMGLETIGGLFKLVMHKYTATTGLWSILATPIDLPANTRYFSISVSPSDIPCVIYRNNEGSSTFVYIDNETQVWTSPFEFNSPLPDLRKADFDFASDGVGYAAYPDADKYITIWKYIEENE